jgi:pantoate--beta-alanine ligase
MAAAAQRTRAEGLKLGLVPTMGYFHEGHLSLMRRARRACDVVAVSLFVNPGQFGPDEDFGRYPRNFDRDAALAEGERVDYIFAPADADMYPAGYATYVNVEGLTGVLCGASRPGHFRGVATVVAKLFQICRPHVSYFGAKDYQQTLVIKRLTRDLDFDVAVEVLPTVREPDGLAMSSRNDYLSAAERRQATCLYRALAAAQRLFRGGEKDPARYQAEMGRVIAAEPAARAEYVELRDPEELTPVTEVRAGTLAALAVYIGKSRLIDNTLLGVDDAFSE